MQAKVRQAISALLLMRSFAFLKGALKALPILLGIIALVLNDWTTGFWSFSDPLLIIGVAIMLPGLTKIRPVQLLAISAITLLVVANVFAAESTGDAISVMDGVPYLAKISLYVLYVILLYNHVIKHSLKTIAFSLLTNVAVIVCLIGIYITIAILVGLPYEFFWEYTRQDLASYNFRGDSGLIRTRSIMSEPQHLGLFLNIVLIIALFSSEKMNISKLKLGLVVLAATLTFSFSTIPVTLLILLISFVKNDGIFFFLKRTFAATLIAVAIAAMPLWGYIEQTILDRGAQITQGDDGSATKRIYDSWSYINPDHLILGNGIGTTPPIWNNYAYVLSEFGLIGFAGIIYLTIVIYRRNKYFGLFFILFSFQKGGYLAAFYWILILLLFIFSAVESRKANNKKQGEVHERK